MTGFDLALPRRVLFGPGRAAELPGLLPSLGRRVLLCTGQGSLPLRAPPGRRRPRRRGDRPARADSGRRPHRDRTRPERLRRRRRGHRRRQRARPRQGRGGPARQRHRPAGPPRGRRPRPADRAAGAALCRRSHHRRHRRRGDRERAPALPGARREGEPPQLSHARRRRARRPPPHAVLPARGDREQRPRRPHPVPGAVRLAPRQPCHGRLRDGRPAPRRRGAATCVRARRRRARPRGHGGVQPLRRLRPRERQARRGARARGRDRRDRRRGPRGDLRRAASRPPSRRTCGHCGTARPAPWPCRDTSTPPGC